MSSFLYNLGYDEFVAWCFLEFYEWGHN